MPLTFWSNGIAVEYDPGMTAAVTLPGLTDHTVTGIDVLYGFEQELVSSNEDGDLMIQDILIKDYPVIIRLSQ